MTQAPINWFQLMGPSPKSIVMNYLNSLQNQGIGQLHIDDDARLVLRNWMLAKKRTSLSGQPPREKNIPDESDFPTLAKVMEDTPDYITETNEADEIPGEIKLQGNTLDEQLFALHSLAEHWQPVKKLGSLRDTMVFSVGNPKSKIMLVGEAPGYQEELQKEPFVGPAGEKLNAILKAMGLNRTTIYISNIVKFRPSIPRQTTNNRAPNEKEIAASMPIISKEIELIRPSVIVALGATAARGLLNSGQAPLSSLRGKFHRFMDIPVRATYHPSYLLRTESLGERRKVWEDMLAVMEYLKMPISEKQRGYFLPKQ